MHVESPFKLIVLGLQPSFNNLKLKLSDLSLPQKQFVCIDASLALSNQNKKWQA
jgi:hypothetical protein